MTEIDEVPRRKIACAMVVHGHAIHGSLRAAAVDPVERHDRESAFNQIVEMLEIEGRRGRDDAAYAEGEEIGGALPLARRVAKRIAEQDLKPARLRRMLDGLRHRAMERIGD